MKQPDTTTPTEPVTEQARPLPRIEPREPLRWFAEEMEIKLRANDHKAHWRHCDDAYLLSRMSDEKMELRRAVRELAEGCRQSDERARELARAVIEEAADIANFAMMVADNARVFFGGAKFQESESAPFSPFCLDCGHALTEADYRAPVCPYCGCA